MGKKLISIDPSFNGATAIVIGDIWGKNINITNFDVLDFKFDKLSGINLKMERYNLLYELIEFVLNEKPDLVVIEDFIQYRAQVMPSGNSFPTAEMIGVLEYHLLMNGVPTIRQRASNLNIPFKKVYKKGLSTKDLVELGLLARTRYNRLNIVMDGELYPLSDYKVGSKNDHAIMALRHMVNIVKYKSITGIINKQKKKIGE